MPEVFWPVVTLLLGWFLSEASHQRRSRAEMRAALGRALAELMEVLHYSRSVKAVLIEMQRRIHIPLAERAKLLDVLHGFMPPDPGLPERFSAAVDRITGTHPVLAFRLRSKDQIPVVVLKLRAAIVAQPPSGGDHEALEALISDLAIDALGDSCLELARSYGLWTWFRVRRFVHKPAELPSEYLKLLDRHFPVSAPPVGA